MLPRRKKFKAKKKFDYHKKNYSNPFFRHKKRLKIKSPSLTWRVKLIIAEIIILTAGIIWFCCFSTYFAINVINVIGAEKISSQEIEALIWKQIEHSRFLFGSQKNLFLFNTDELIKTLNEQYCLDNIAVQKKLPNILIIEFREKIYSVIWHQSDKYYYIDETGNIISETNPLEIKQKNYPLVDYQGGGEIIGQKINDQGDKINFIIQLFNNFKFTPIQRNFETDQAENEFKIERFIIDNEPNTVKMIINQGPEVYFSTRENLEKQVTKLSVLINEKLKDDFFEKKYIDLRYGDRVYYH